MRTSRSSGTTTYSYIYNGSKLTQMTVGSDTLYFAYDASTPMSVTYNNTTYYYVTNLQGDVIAILNSEGQAVVTYTYDAWSNHLSTGGTMASTLGTLNPLRYRGYVYDQETGLYYLQSRYYNPELGRFINADAYISTGLGIHCNNMFAYCSDNPVNGFDPCGTCFHRLDFWNDCEQCGGETIQEKLNNLASWCADTFESIKEYVSNTDPKAAIDGKGITFFNGVPVVHLPFDWTAFSFGVIVLGSQYKSNKFGLDILHHEYGHILQLREYGLVSYTFTIAIPSVACNLLSRADLLPWTYYSSPWEYEANELGRVKRTDYAPWAKSFSQSYSKFSRYVQVLDIFSYLAINWG